MTRGRIYLCDNSKVWYKTIQYLSDMYLTFPEGHGNEIISAFVRRQIRNHNDLLKYTVKSYKEWFEKMFTMNMTKLKLLSLCGISIS